MSRDTGRKQGLMTIEEFASAIGMRPATIRQWVWRRQVEFVRLGRAIRFRPKTAERIVERGTIPALNAPPRPTHRERDIAN